MRCFLKIRIHSCIGSSSSDVCVFKEILDNSSLINSLTKCLHDDISQSKKLGFKLFYQSDKTFYNNARINLHLKPFERGENLPEYKAIVQRYLQDGWVTSIPWLEEKLVLYWEEQARKEECKRKKEGYVLPTTPRKFLDGSVDIEAYRGGFSDKVFKQKELQDYVSKGSVFGYIGHYARKANIDQHLEEKFLSLPTKEDLPRLLAVWLTSSDGRHVADSIFGISFMEQKKIIDDGVCFYFNKALVYADPEHDGSMGSMNAELQNRYLGRFLNA